MIQILTENEQEKEKITEEIEKTIMQVCETALNEEHFNSDVQISLTFTDNAGIKEMNAEYRDIDRATDVLSFPMLDFEEPGKPIEDSADKDGSFILLGDIVISLERAREQAEEYGHTFRREVAFLTAHSMLHLLGYDHVDDPEGEKIMFAKQDEILNILGISRDI